MIGGFASAFPALHEIKVGLQCAGTGDPARLFRTPEVDISIFRYPHDYVFAFGSRGQAQGALDQLQPILVCIEILHRGPPEGRYPLGCGKRRHREMISFFGRTEEAAGRLFQHRSVQGGVEPALCGEGSFVGCAPGVEKGAWRGQRESQVIPRGPLSIQKRGLNIADMANADARLPRKVGEFPIAIRGADKNAEHLCRAAL